MYNENLKKSFMDETVNSVNDSDMYQLIFKTTAKFEEKFSTDLCNMNRLQYEEALKQVGGIKKGYNLVVIHHIKFYRSWCESKGLPTSDVEIKDMSFGEDKYKKHMIINSAHLECALDSMFDKVECKTNDSIIRAALWLLYSGIRPKDIGNVKKSDVDLKSMWIYFNDRRYPIYREAAECLHFCKTSKEFVYNHPRYDPVIKDRMVSDLLLSSTKGIMVENTLNTALVKRKSKIRDSEKELIVDLNCEHTWLSGVFYRAREFELISNEEEDFTSCIEDLMKERKGDEGYSLGNNKLCSIVNKKARAMRESYLAWRSLLNN